VQLSWSKIITSTAVLRSDK